MNKNSNAYQILYSAIMVVLVGAVLAVIYMNLKPFQDENIANDKRKQILSALHVTCNSADEIKTAYEKYVVQDLLINAEGEVVDSSANVAFDVNMKANVKLAEDARQLPVMKCKVDDGTIKYVIPVYGAGLWGPIWGYVAVDSDGNTVYGANFSHEGETPGLGARIAEEPFQDSFKGKKMFVEGAFKNIEVVKKGQKPANGGEYVDALTGATITSRGVSDMLQACLAPYQKFLESLQGVTETKE